MAKVRLHTGPGVFEVLANVCRNPQEALKQFVENAADAIEQAKTDEGQIRPRLQYEPSANGTKRSLKSIGIEDNGNIILTKFLDLPDSASRGKAGRGKMS